MRSIYKIKAVVLIGVIFLLGCSEKEVKPEKTVQSGVIKIINEPIINEPTTQINFEKSATYATTDEIIIAEVSDIAADDKGRVFIKDDRQSIVHVFNDDATYVTSLGREGRGPGEFSSRSAKTKIEIGTDNVLYATDGSGDFAYRAQVFDLKYLSFAYTLKLRNENLSSYADLEGHTPKQVFSRRDETFLVVYYPGLLQLTNSENFIHFVIQDRQGEIISEPILKVRDPVYLSHFVEDAPYPFHAMHNFPFSPKTVFDVADNGEIYTAWTSEFKIDVHSPEGEWIRSIEHPFENLPLDIEKLKAHYKETNYMRQLGEGVTEKILDQEENIPTAWPAIHDLLLDDENRLWVSTVVKDQDIYEWWIMEDTGEVITKFEWPRDKPIEIIRNGSIYTQEEQPDTGEEEVVRYAFGITGL